MRGIEQKKLKKKYGAGPARCRRRGWGGSRIAGFEDGSACKGELPRKRDASGCGFVHDCSSVSHCWSAEGHCDVDFPASQTAALLTNWRPTLCQLVPIRPLNSSIFRSCPPADHDAEHRQKALREGAEGVGRFAAVEGDGDDGVCRRARSGRSPGIEAYRLGT